MIYRCLDTMTSYQMAQVAKDCYHSPSFTGDVRIIPQFFGCIGTYIIADMPEDVYVKWNEYLKVEK